MSRETANVQRARIVLEHWRDAAMASNVDERRLYTAHPLALVELALNGETDPAQLGIEPGPDRDRLAAVVDALPDWLMRLALDATRTGESDSRVEQQEIRLAEWLYDTFERDEGPPYGGLTRAEQLAWHYRAMQALDAAAGLPTGGVEP